MINFEGAVNNIEKKLDYPAELEQMLGLSPVIDQIEKSLMCL